jgi:hypothetical protein
MLSRRLTPALLMATLPLIAFADDEFDEDWLGDDFERRIAKVNQGELVFLSEPPPEPVHHHQNRLILDSESLDHGWVTLIQCHRHLDAVPRTQVLYHQTRTRKLSILSYDNIQSAWIEGHTVQLSGVEHGASICIQARTRTLEFNEDGSFTLRGGPYMRRFLDGYYPMRVSMNIQVPRDYLRFVGTRPQSQDGFRVEETADGINIDAWFEGKLYTEVHFEADFCHEPASSSC